MIKRSMPINCKGTSFLVASVIFSVFSDARAGVVSGDDTFNSGVRVDSIENGQSVRCFDDRVLPYSIYRYDEATTSLRVYPGPEIASSWSSSWEDYEGMYCADMNKGEPMIYNLSIFPDGQSIKCVDDVDTSSIYRLDSPTLSLRQYPDFAVGSSWDPNYAQYRTIDCTGIEKGSPMSLKTDQYSSAYESTQAPTMLRGSTASPTASPTVSFSASPTVSPTDSNSPLFRSWEITQEPGATISTGDDGSQVIIIPYSASNRVYTVEVFETDCSTSTAIPSIRHLEKRSATYGFIDVTVDLTISSSADLEASDTFTSTSDMVGTLSFCLSYTMYLNENKNVVRNKKDIIFNARVDIRNGVSITGLNSYTLINL